MRFSKKVALMGTIISSNEQVNSAYVRVVTILRGYLLNVELYKALNSQFDFEKNGTAPITVSILPFNIFHIFLKHFTVSCKLSMFARVCFATFHDSCRRRAFPMSP